MEGMEKPQNLALIAIFFQSQHTLTPGKGVEISITQSLKSFDSNPYIICSPTYALPFFGLDIFFR